MKTTLRHTTYLTAYKFNGKEMDAETGLYYYGARYYEPELAMWYGVDALAEKYANMGAYVYCAGNPVKLVDVDGNDHWEIDAEGNAKIIDSQGDKIFVNDQKLSSFNFDTHEKLQSLGTILSHYYGEEGSKAKQLHGGSISIMSYKGYSDMVDSYNWDEEKSPYKSCPKPIALGVNKTNGYNDKKIAVFVENGRVSETFNSKWNVMSIFIHEGKHTEQDLSKYGNSIVIRTECELKAYLAQIKDPSWIHVTKRLKNTITDNILDNLTKLYYGGAQEKHYEYREIFKKKGISY